MDGCIWARRRPPVDERMTSTNALGLPAHFAHRSAFDTGVLAVICACRRDLILVDRDFHDWPLETPQGAALLDEWLRRDRRARIRLLVHQPDWLARQAPRLARLRRLRPEAFECRRLPDEAFDGSGLLLGDQQHVLKRAHCDSFRGTLQSGTSARAHALWAQWDQVWQAATTCLPGTTLGL
jgi:hypothetical protein